jgi:hypothetical protein
MIADESPGWNRGFESYPSMHIREGSSTEWRTTVWLIPAYPNPPIRSRIKMQACPRTPSSAALGAKS